MATSQRVPMDSWDHRRSGAARFSGSLDPRTLLLRRYLTCLLPWLFLALVVLVLACCCRCRGILLVCGLSMLVGLTGYSSDFSGRHGIRTHTALAAPHGLANRPAKRVSHETYRSCDP